MDDLLWLEQIHPSTRYQVGEKAFYLSHLLQKGYPVIPGFAIPSPSLRQFLETIDWLDQLFADLPSSSLHLNVDNFRQLQQVAQHIRYAITTATLPSAWVDKLLAAAEELSSPFVILRPSVTLPSATGLNTDLKISGLLESSVCACNAEAIAAGVKQVWSELFRARSLLYWQRAGIQLQQIKLAILVQPLWNAQASGYLQTYPELWEVQATWGLGMALVRGEVLPDYYQVQPETNSIAFQKIGNKTLAYRLDDSLLLQKPLQTYLLSEEQQRQYAMEEKYLEQLLELTHRLTDEFGSRIILEWTLCQMTTEADPHLYLTRIYPRPGLASSQSQLSESVLPKERRKIAGFTPPLSSVAQSAIASGTALRAIADSSSVITGLGASSGRVMARATVIVNGIDDPEKMPSGRILIAHNVTPDWLPLLKRTAGVVAEQGGLTSHSAIIARELGIPAVVGAMGATQMIQTDDLVMVDGERGEIYRVEVASLESQGNQEHRSSKELSFSVMSNSLAQTAMARSAVPEAIATDLLVNLSQHQDIDVARSLPIDGVGLLRSEMMMMEVVEGKHPSWWIKQGRQAELVERLTEKINLFAEGFAPRPVFYRSLDLRSHEFPTLTGRPSLPPETNPMLGLRGTFSYLSDPAIFDLELAALVEVYRAGYTNVHLMLPFVRTVEEFSFCRRRVEQAGLTQQAQFQLWIMAEVPSVLFLLPDFVKAGVQGISIGTNDLTQLLLGVDRDQSQMATAFDERHPAVMLSMKQLIQTAKQLGIPCSICGQAPAQYPELVEPLVSWGINSISVSLEAIEQTYMAIARAEKRLLLEAARRQLS